MAKISLTIEAADSTDLADTISSLMYLSAYKTENEIVNDADDGFEQMNAGVTQDAEPGERQRRTRRTKAQIAEDNARAAASGSTVEAAKLASDSGMEAGTRASGGATTGADPFGDQVREVVAEAKTNGALTLADVEATGRKAFEKIGAPALQALIIQHANGAKSFKDPLLTPEHFEPLHAALVEACGG